MSAPELVPWIDSAGEGGDRNSMQQFDGNGTTTSFDFSFSGGYIFATDVKAYLYDLASGLTSAVTPVVLTGPSTIEVIPAPAAVNVDRTVGEVLVVYRDTQKSTPLVNYSTGAVMDETNLDMSNKQAVFVAAEMVDRFDAINASSADAVERSFEALTTANTALSQSNTALTNSTNAVTTANAASATADNALAVAEDAVAAATGFQTDLQFYEANDTTQRGAVWQLGTIALPGNKRWFAGVDGGSDYTLQRYNDAGVLQGTAFKVSRASGLITVANRITGVSNATGAADAVNKGQMDAADALKINVDGTIDFTGHQKLKDSSPTLALHAASKGYVDTQDSLYASDDSEIIINPHGSIAQEGLGVVTVLNGNYFVDQWQCFKQLSTGTAQAGTVTNAALSLIDFHSMFLKVTTAQGSLAATDNLGILQPVEGYRLRRLLYGTAQARGSWLQFRGSVTGVASAVVALSVRNTATTRSFVQTFTLTTTPQTFSVFVPGDTTGTWVNDNNLAATVTFIAASGTTGQTPTLGAWQAGSFYSHASVTNLAATLNAQLNITDVSWKPSSILLPLRSIDIQQEIAKCQRYWEAGSVIMTCGNPGNGNAFSYTQSFLVPKRTGASTITYGTPSYVNATGITTAAVNVSIFTPQATSTTGVSPAMVQFAVGYQANNRM